MLLALARTWGYPAIPVSLSTAEGFAIVLCPSQGTSAYEVIFISGGATSHIRRHQLTWAQHNNTEKLTFSTSVTDAQDKEEGKGKMINFNYIE